MESEILDQRPTVSIIIPIYNVENYIEKCIDSAVNQTYGKIEIICVNDGSTDNSMKIVQKKVNNDIRVQIVNIENSGLSVARNIGLERAEGKYIMFLDSDDYLTLDAIENLLECAEKNSTDILFFGAETVFENKKVERQHSEYAEYYNRNSEYPQVYEGEELFVNLMNSYDFKPSACLMLIKRQFLESVHVKFYPGILHEDNLFTVQLLHYAKRAMVMDRIFYKRLVRGGSITSGEKGIKRAYGLFVCHREILKCVSLWDCSNQFLIALMNYLSNMKKIAVRNLGDIEIDNILYEINKIASEEICYFFEYIYDAKLGSTIQTEHTLSRWLSRMNNVYMYLKRNGIKSTWKMINYRLKQIALKRNREG